MKFEEFAIKTLLEMEHGPKSDEDVRACIAFEKRRNKYMQPLWDDTIDDQESNTEFLLHCKKSIEDSWTDFLWNEHDNGGNEPEDVYDMVILSNAVNSTRRKIVVDIMSRSVIEFNNMVSARESLGAVISELGELEDGYQRLVEYVMEVENDDLRAIAMYNLVCSIKEADEIRWFIDFVEWYHSAHGEFEAESVELEWFVVNIAEMEQKTRVLHVLVNSEDITTRERNLILRNMENLRRFGAWAKLIIEAGVPNTEGLFCSVYEKIGAWLDVPDGIAVEYEGATPVFSRK